jgi:hypothetical protein
MKSIAIVGLLAVTLGTTGCSCFRRSAPAPVAACAPAPVCPNPCAPGAVTYGYGSGYAVPGGAYMPMPQ